MLHQAENFARQLAFDMRPSPTLRKITVVLDHGPTTIESLTRAVLFAFAFVFFLIAAGVPVHAGEQADRPESICQLIESAAQSNGLPVEFFARLIWQESRFQPDEIGPVTRSGERAQGIAQFMPGTAAERQLYEPFDPNEALPKSGEFLAELRGEFGNLGLAAAAYNAGPQRVRDYLAGLHDLPSETRHYVLAITGRSVDEWATAAELAASGEHVAKVESEPVSPNCHELVARLARLEDPLIAQWQGRNVPSWCKGLHHPNTSVCGPVHLRTLVSKVASLMFPRSHVHLPRSSSR